MAYAVMAYIVMAYIFMAYIVMTTDLSSIALFVRRRYPTMAESFGTSLTCKCGDVTVAFATKPAYAAECVCSDCLARFNGMAQRGGVAIPQKYLDQDECLLLYYFQDCIKIVSGRANLYFYKLAEDSTTLNCATSCCHTVVLVCNTKNAPTLIAVAESLTPVMPRISITPELRWWSAKIPPEKLAKMEALPTPADKTALAKFMEVASAELPAGDDQSTHFLTLFQECGGKAEVLPPSKI